MAGDRNIPFEIRRIDRAVGLFLTGAVVIALAALFIRQQGTGEFGRKLNYHTILTQSYGLARGVDITLSGQKIGSIQSVRLQGDGKVRVDVELFDKYQEFYTAGSELDVISNFGLPTMLGGGGLAFLSNDKTQTALVEGAFIKPLEPVDIAAIIKQLDLPGMATKVTSIVSNVEKITLRLKEDQGALFATLQNIESVTKNLAQSTETLPALLTDFEQRIPNILTAMEGSLSGLQKSMDSVSNVISGSEQDIRALIQNSANASDELNHIAAELNSMLKKVDSIPGIIAASEELVENSAELTEKLNNHWLLGGDKDQTASKHWPAVHSKGQSPYDQAQ